MLCIKKNKWFSTVLLSFYRKNLETENILVRVCVCVYVLLRPVETNWDPLEPFGIRWNQLGSIGTL